MKRFIVTTAALFVALAASIASAQSIKQTKDGKYQVTTPTGETVTVGKDGTIESGMPMMGKPSSSGGESGTLKLRGGSSKEPRTKAGPQKCVANRDLSVENKEIVGQAVAITMVGSCDTEIFNTRIDATKNAIDVVGTGELHVEESTVHGAEIAINLSGTGDVFVENAEISGPIAINITGTGNVSIKNSTIAGKIVVTGTGQFIDVGGNKIVEKPLGKTARKTPADTKKSKKSSKK